MNISGKESCCLSVSNLVMCEGVMKNRAWPVLSHLRGIGFLLMWNKSQIQNFFFSSTGRKSTHTANGLRSGVLHWGLKPLSTTESPGSPTCIIVRQRYLSVSKSFIFKANLLAACQTRGSEFDKLWFYRVNYDLRDLLLTSRSSGIHASVGQWLCCTGGQGDLQSY